MTFEQWWEVEFPNVNIEWYENSTDFNTKEWFDVVRSAFEAGKESAKESK